METKFNLNLAHIPEELKLIFEIIKYEEVEKLQVYLKSLHRNIDWQKFVDLSMHHRVFPVLISKLKKIEEKIIPSFVINVLNKVYRQNTFYMLHLSREMEEINNMFNKNQIRMLVLKGPVLGADLYGDVSLRTAGDLDILIPIDKINHADKILSNNGYEKDDYIQTILNDWTWRHHHVTYFNKEKNIKMEIHWRLNPGPGMEPCFDDLWDRKRLSPLTGSSVHYLGREDLFLFLASHGARHGWSRLRWLVDIKQLVQQKIDWKFLIRLLRKYQYLNIGGQSLVLVSEIFNTPIPTEFYKIARGGRPSKLAQDAIFYLETMINLHSGPLPEDIALYHKRHLIKLMSNKQKVLFILSLLYPYPEDAITLPLPKCLHFLYFLLRPFLWAWRKTRHHAVT